MILIKRRDRVVRMRNIKKKKFREIAEILGVSKGRAIQIYNQGIRYIEQEKNKSYDPFKQLSIRSQNILWNHGIKSKDDLRKAVLNNSFYLGNGWRMLGKQTVLECLKWANLEGITCVNYTQKELIQKLIESLERLISACPSAWCKNEINQGRHFIKIAKRIEK